MLGLGLWEGIVWCRCLTLRMQEQFPLHAYAMAGEVDTYFSDQGGIQQEREWQCRPSWTLNHDNTRGRDPLKTIQSWGPLPSDCTQITLSIDIHSYSNIWRSICTAWRVFMPSWHGYHSYALVPGTILWTIDCVYLQLPSGHPPLAELKALQSEQCRILYSITSVGWAFSTARCCGSLVGLLHS